MNSTVVNILFLALGIILGFVIAYIVERLKEGRTRRRIAIVLKNEISSCSRSARKELDNLNKIPNIPSDIQQERIFLASFLLSREVFVTIFFDIYKMNIHLFREETQKAVAIFYTLIFVLIEDIQKINPLIDKPTQPSEAIEDFYKIQIKLRTDIIETAKYCEFLLKDETRIRLPLRLFKSKASN
jgi:hypothetical protein